MRWRWSDAGAWASRGSSGGLPTVSPRSSSSPTGGCVTTQMARFAAALEPAFGVRPEIRSVAELIGLLYELGRERKVLAVVDRYAVAGGMARYLGELGHGSLRTRVCAGVLDRRGPLFDDPRAVLEQELRNPATYFSILECSPTGPPRPSASRMRCRSTARRSTFYLDTLGAQCDCFHARRRLERPRVPHAQVPRKRRLHPVPGSVRVRKPREGLQEGLALQDLWDADIEPHLADFVASTFEELSYPLHRVASLRPRRSPRPAGRWGPATAQAPAEPRTADRGDRCRRRSPRQP